VLLLLLEDGLEVLLLGELRGGKKRRRARGKKAVERTWPLGLNTKPPVLRGTPTVRKGQAAGHSTQQPHTAPTPIRK
jgi:hypothetical protein